jgi:alkylhydroperoxidase family enzyme
MRIKTGQVNDCQYCMEVRTTAVRGAVTPKEAALRKSQPEPGAELNEREALAVQFAERIAFDPHTVDDEFFARLRKVFSEEEIIELTFACGIFNWGDKFNITMHMDSESSSAYAKNLKYREEKL